MVKEEAQIRERFVEFLSSRSFKKQYLTGFFPSQLWRLIVALVAFCSAVGAPIGFYQIFRAWQNRRGARLASLIRSIRRSRLIMVDVLMANSTLYRVAGSIAPALVMGTFDPEVAADEDFMHELFMKVASLGLGGAEGPAEEEVARMMADEAYTAGRRRRLPSGLTGGRTVYLFDLQVVGDYRPGGKLDTATLACLAEPGPSGQIAMLPWWIAEGGADPGG